MTYAERLTLARTWLRDARHVAVLTGAGISKASGIPTFRDADGAWQHIDPHTFLTVRNFQAHPADVWAWHLAKYRLIRAADPNSGHRALVTLETQVRSACPDATFTVVTQNIDGLHQAAGSAHVLELHGSVHEARCERCEVAFALPDPDELGTVIHCPACGRISRPQVVWFSELLDPEVLGAATRAFERADVTLVIGTSALVYPAANLPRLTSREGGVVIEINPDVTDLTASCDLSLRCGAHEGLTLLLGLLGNAP